MARTQDLRQRRSAGHRLRVGSTDGTSITVHVPLAFRRRQGRKVLVAPDGTDAVPQVGARPSLGRPHVTPAAKALARAFRWRRLIETGTVATVHEIATAECINASYVSRVLRLTLLAPEVVEALTAPRAEDARSLDRLMKPFPVAWQTHGPLVGRNDDWQGTYNGSRGPSH